MARNSSGTHSLPEAPVVADTVIDPDWANNTLNDLSAELTDSLSRSGKGGMLTYLRGIDGSAALPAYSFTNQIQSGMYRAGSGDMRFAYNGTDLFKFNATENRSYNALKVTAGGLTVDSGGVTVTAGGATVTAGGLTVTAGGATVTAGGLTVTAGGLTVSSGGAVVASSTGAALTATSTGGAGVSAMGAAGAPGGVFATGTNATGATPQTALTLSNGHLLLSGTAPNKDVALSNTLTPANMTQVWVRITADGVNAAGIVAADGYNVSSISWDNITNTVTVNFAVTFANTHYAVSGSGDLSASSAQRVPCVQSRATTNLTVALLDVASAGPVDLDSFANGFSLTITGRLA